MNVIKRDGKEVPFQRGKIHRAIQKANQEVDETEKLNEQELSEIVDEISARIAGVNMFHTPSVEEIQDIVEDELMEYTAYAVAKKYIRYRYKREVVRENTASFLSSLKPKIEAEDVQNQNANVDEKSFGGRVGEASNEMMKQYALNFCLSDMARKNHLNNEIYTHDLSSYAVGNHNCLSIPFDDLLKNGFNTRQTDIRPAGSIETAFQLVAVIFQIQSLQQFGGVSATHLDWTMVPYVRKSFYKHYRDGMTYINGVSDWLSGGNDVSIDAMVYKAAPNVYQYAMDMTKKELKQAAEGLFHNLNSLQSRSGNQLNGWLRCW